MIIKGSLAADLLRIVLYSEGVSLDDLSIELI